MTGQRRGLSLDVRDSGVAILTIRGGGQLNLLDHESHRDLNDVWQEVDDHPGIRVTVVTGQGNAFCAGGDLTDYRGTMGSASEALKTLDVTVQLVERLLSCKKPVVSAINGPAVGAGLAVALLADISVIGEGVRIGDGHARIGLSAGDHGVVLWPLLCGIAKSKYYLMLAEDMDGREAERIGLVSRCVPDDQVLTEALRIAERLAAGSQRAVQATKRTLNHWLRAAQPAFEHSAALEVLQMMTPDAAEGFAALLEKRAPRYE